MSSKTPADLLDQAADLIEQRGLAHGTYEESDGRLCALGALNLADHGDVEISMLTQSRECTIAKRLLDGAISDEMSVADWNDDSDASTVVATLRAAAAKARQS